MKRFLLAAAAALMMAGTANAKETHRCDVRDPDTGQAVAVLHVTVDPPKHVDDGGNAVAQIKRGDAVLRQFDWAIVSNPENASTKGTVVGFFAQNSGIYTRGFKYDVVTGSGAFYEYGDVRYALSDCRMTVIG